MARITYKQNPRDRFSLEKSYKATRNKVVVANVGEHQGGWYWHTMNRPDHIPLWNTLNHRPPFASLDEAKADLVKWLAQHWPE